MIKFIKLHIIDDDTITVNYINVNHILKVYMSDKNVHVELINKEILIQQCNLIAIRFWK